MVKEKKTKDKREEFRSVETFFISGSVLTSNVLEQRYINFLTRIHTYRRGFFFVSIHKKLSVTTCSHPREKLNTIIRKAGSIVH